jgi:LPXTG-site transpeptidase (sortase) family protein
MGRYFNQGFSRLLPVGLAAAALAVAFSLNLPNVAQAKSAGSWRGEGVGGQQPQPLLAPGVGITIAAPASVPIGSPFSFGVTFDNTAPNVAGNTGYGPFIDLVFPVTGADGAGAAIDDGIDFVSANYLGGSVTTTSFTFPGPGPTGCVNHPYAVAPITGAPLQVCGKTGDKLVVIQLPFGSFTPNQTPATVTVNATLNSFADLNAGLAVRARGGYQYGATPLSDWCCPPYDATILTDTNPDPATWATSATVTPSLLTLTKVYSGPESETATGPNYPRQYTLTATWPAGQSISNLNITDFLPNNEAFLSVVSTSPAGGTATQTPTVGAGANSPNNDLVIHWAGPLTGGTATVVFDYFIPLNDANASPVINAASGNDALSPNNAEVGASWTPLDPRDSLTPVSDSVGTIDHTLIDKSIAIQKGVANVNDIAPTGYTPGDTLEYTLDFQVSDFFAFNNINITDILSDGQHFDSSFTPTLQVNGNSYTLATTNLAANRVDVSCNYSGGPGSECDTDDAATNNGKTTLVFHVSQALVDNSQTGKLIGGCIPVAGTGGPVPNCTTTNDGPTTGVIKFRAIILDQFTDDFPSGDQSVDHGDTLSNNVTITGDLLSVSNANTPTGQSEADDSAAGIAIEFGALQKSIYAVNGSTSFTTPVHIKPGDTLTYRLRYTLPTSDFEALTLVDFLPLPVFSASEVATFDDTISAAAPPAGTYKFGPTETFRTLAGNSVACPPPAAANADGTPCVVIDTDSNSLTFNYGNYDDPGNTSTVIDLLFTVTVSNDPFADGLFLTNQAHAREGTTNAGDQNLDQIVQIVLDEPLLTTTKGVIATSNSAQVFSPSPAGPVTFNDPGTGAPAGGSPRWSTTINSTNIGSIPINSNVAGVDAGDLVTFAIVVQNQGHSANGAFDVTLTDTLPAGYVIPAGGLNLRISHGDGASVPFTGLGGGPDATANTQDDIFGTGLQVNDPGTGVGACQVHDATNGLDLLIVTYDLQLDPTVTPNQGIINTSALTHYSNEEGGPNFLPDDGPLTDTATSTIAKPVLDKVFVSTEFNTATNSNSQAVIGELATYQFTLTVPEGAMPSASVTDTLDAGLAFVDIQSVTPAGSLTIATPIGTGTSPSNVTINAAGNVLTFNFGNITNSNTDNSTAETIVIIYRAVVLDVFSNQAGTQLNNAATVSWTSNGPQAQLTPTTNITLLEPHITTAKSVSTGPYDAGDTVTFTIVLTNPNGASDADAYEMQWSDAVPTGLTYVASSFAIGTCSAGSPTINDAGAPTLTASLATFPKNTSCTFTFQATLNGSVIPGQTITNTAHTIWTSLSGTVTDRSTHNAASDERTGTFAGPTFGNGTNVNPDDYHSSSSVGLTVAAVALLKFLEATSEASTSDASLPFSGTTNPPSGTIGEILRFRLIAQIPESTIANFQVTDALPAGLTFLDDGTARVAFISNGGTGGIVSSATGTLPVPAISSGCILTGSTANGATPASLPCLLADGNIGSDNSTATDPDTYAPDTDPVFKLGDLVNNDRDSDGEYVVIEFNALINNTAANNAGDTITNTFSTTTVNSGTTNLAVKVVEPSIPVTTTTKTVTPTSGDESDLVTYTVAFTSANGANNTTAFNVQVKDILPADLTLNLGSISVTSACATGSDTSNSTGNTVDVRFTSIPVNCLVTITYTATLNVTVNPGEVITNTATITYSSLPGTGTTPNSTGGTTPGASGATNGERDGSGGVNDYTGNDTAAVTVTGTSISKTIVATSESTTAEVDPRPVTIGEVVRYRIVLQVPESTIPNLQLRDVFNGGGFGQNYIVGSARYAFVGDSTSSLSSSTFSSGNPNQATGLSCPNISGTFTLAQAASAASIASSAVTCTFNDDNISSSETTNADVYTQNTTVRFKYGNLVNVDSDSNNEYVIVEFNALVDNTTGVDSNDAGDTPSDTARARDGATPGNLGGTVTRNLLVVEPSIPFSSGANNKTASPTQGDALDTITYTVTYTAASGANNTDAFDVVLTDNLSSLPVNNLAFVSATPTGCTTPGTITSSTTSGILTVTVPHVSTGCTIVITYTAQLTAAATPGQVVTNTASLVYSSLPGTGTTSNPTGSNTPGGSGATNGERNGSGGVNDYTGSDTAAVTLYSNSVGGFVYIDADNDGIKDVGETPISTVTVALSGTDHLGNPVTASTTTSGTGAYSFTGLRPGTYTITETQPAYLDGKDTAGTPFGGSNAVNDVLSGLVIPLGSNPAGQDYNFGELQPASVAGFVYHDADNDGVKDGTESGIQTVTVTLTGTDDLGNSVNTPTTTDVNGAYSFTGLRPGTYVITETQPGAYFDGKDTIGTPGGTTGNDTFTNIVLNSGTAGINNNFGELLPASLSGFVYYDADNDGSFDGTELPIDLVAIDLSGTDDLGNPVTASSTTDVNGAYSFDNLRPGTYVITETQPSAYLDGKDTIGTPGGTTGSDTFTAIVLNSGVDGINNNFGELLAASLSGFVYYDADNDGVFDGTELPIDTVTVTLTGTDDLGNPVNTPTTTDVNGAYSFTGLRPGTYVITETQPAGYLDGKDTVGTPGGTTTNDKFSAINLVAGFDGVNNNFGEVKAASLSGFVYVDADNDGVFDGTELPIETVTVTLTGTDDLGNSVNTPTTTDVNGAYSFINLRPGTYVITETQPSAYLDGKDTVGTPGGTTTNDKFSAINLVAGFDGVNNNFGELGSASLAGNVYIDADNDGVFDVTESGIETVTITLTGTDDLSNPVNLSTTTAADGSYIFDNLRPGTYTLTETQPAGYLDGKDTIGTPGGNTANDVFSNIVIGVGTVGTNNNFGEFLAASLTGNVYHDADDDGVFDGTEDGIETVTVDLSGTDDLGNTVTASTTTAADGSYSFPNLRPGTYIITETQPPVYLDGKDTIGTPGGTTGSDTFTNIVLNPGVNGINNNFGEVLVSSLAGFVYLDADNDGVFDGTESPIESVTVDLSGTDDLGNAVTASTTTDVNGAYSFINLRPGTYTLTETQPAGYLDGKDTIGTPGGTTGNDTFTSIILLSHVDGTDNNFGELLSASLAGNVYVDANNDGVFDGTESGIQTVTVTLTGTNDLGSVSQSTTTAADGSYSFINLRPGTYVITESQPSTYLDGKDTIGTPGGSTANDVFSAIVLASGDAGTDNNFGEITPASVAGFVYADADNDGVKDAGETGIQNVTITLTGTDDLGSVSLSTTTNINGAYSFINLRPGTYVITETQPSIYLDGKDTIGTPGGTTANDTFSAVVLDQGDAGLNNNFGEIQPASLAGFVYIDKDDDGVFDITEVSIENATVALTGTDDLGSVNLSTTTAADGSYSFDDLRPGTYTLTETQPNGFTDGKDTIGTPGGTTANDVFSNINLAQGVDGVNNNFGEHAASLSGNVYLDSNNNAVINSGEPGIAGVTVTLTGTDVDGGSVTLTTTTAANGTYTFTDLKAGTYTVTETQPAIYSDGQDSFGSSGGTAGNDVISSITLPAGTDAINYNFGELASADLSIIKGIDDTTPLVGQAVTFTVVVSNGGPNNTTGVTVADPLPAGYAFILATVTQGNYNAVSGIWAVGAVANGSSATLTINASVKATGPYNNTAQVTASALPDPDSSPNNNVPTEDDQATVTVTPSGVADLSLTKVVDDPNPANGDTIIYTVTVFNHGPSDATNVSISDVLPAEVTYVSSDAACSQASGTVTCTVASLVNGASASFNITVTVNDASNPFTNSAQVSASDQPDIDSTPNNGTGNGEDDQASVTEPLGSADLSLTKIVDDSTPQVGQDVTFTITITNDGPDQATNVVVSDQLPVGYTYVSSNPSQGSYDDTTGLWSVGTLDLDGTATLDLTGTVNLGGPYLNTAEVVATDQFDTDSTPNNGDGSEDDQASASVTPTGVADLSLTKVADVPTPSVGSTLTYTVTVSNAGPSVATNVAVRDNLPAGVSFVNASAGCSQAAGVVTCTVSSLAVGGSVSFNIAVTVNATGSYANTAQVSASDQFDPDSTPNNNNPSEDDQAGVTAGPANQSDLSLTKVVNNPTPQVGQNVIFTVTVTNAGPLDDTGITVTDLLPSGYTFVSSTPSQGSYTSGTGLWTVGNLAATGSATLQITATVRATGTYLNSAEVTASARPDPDSTPNNNTPSEDDQASVSVTPVPVADLSVTKTVNDNTPVVGSNVTFTITVSNAGPSTATGVAVSDLLPAGLSFVSSTVSQGSYVSGTGVWAVGTLTSGGSATLQIVANVTTIGTKVNTAQVSVSPVLDLDSTPNNNNPSEDDQASISVGAIFDPPVGRKVLSSVGLPQLSWRMVWINSANASAINVQVFDGIPAGTSYTASSLACTARGSSTTTTCTFDSVNNQIVWQGSIGPDSGATNEGNANNEIVITFQTTIGSGVTQVNNQARSVTDSDNDGDFADEPSSSNANTNVATWNLSPTSTPTPTATATPLIADPILTKSVNTSQAGIGQSLIFTLVLHNNGGSTANNVVITDGFPSTVDITATSTTKGTVAVDAAARLVTVSVGDLGANETVTITITVTVNSSLTTTVDQVNTATDVYSFNGSTQTRLSNTVTYRLVFGQTLPSTGEDPGPLSGTPFDWVLLVLSVLAFLGGIGVCWYGILRSQRRWRVYVASGGGLLLVGMILGLIALVQTPSGGDPSAPAPTQVALVPAATSTLGPTASPNATSVGAVSIAPVPSTATAEVGFNEGFASLLGVEPDLPAYPTPTPPAQSTPVGSNSLPDNSSVTRITIPTLNVDATVRYVPFDGLTWPLTGLKKDVAWLGDTSWPGLGSNTVLAGHVTVRGLGRGPFYGLSALRAGDTIVVYSEQNMYTYIVSSRQAVDPTAMQVTYATDQPQLTLITCTEWDPDSRTYERRLVVVAQLDSVVPLSAAAH